MEQEIYYRAVPVEEDLPPVPQIVTVLIDGRIEMQAQIRPTDKPGQKEWWSLGMANAKPLTKVTHWLQRISMEELVNRLSTPQK
jgi:hypothetical protein